MADKDVITIYVVLIVFLLGILWHIFGHLLVVFHSHTTDMAVKEMLKDPHRHVMSEHMCYFVRNMFYLLIVVLLLVAHYKGNVRVTKQVTDIEIKRL